MTVLYLSKMLLLETMLIYSLTFELRLSIGIDYSASTLSLSLFKKIQQWSGRFSYFLDDYEERTFNDEYPEIPPH